ncbi:CBS domain-containing protein [filamentous cyanobacterium LEGE 11480]|uniref:CBS domain-containing protein n=1 Tax=Romeriopsis navalis LEGE 11480 TaxID=2777977 RepID=A0A928Z471_9CYAN|nr:CBS domain-containing protein [Romeriopsis navalis]MBE9030737.1 CBS domain-containing protein [Romeriopsis navalis LEGE 11480]
MMTAADIMTKEVVTISGSATVADAVKLMKDKGLRALVVEPRDQTDPHGMVTETDIIYKVAAFGHDPKALRVYEIMTKPCIAINPELGVEYIARLFAQTRIRRAPVVSGKLLGVISITDILRKSDFVEKPKRLFIEDELEVARSEAREVCAKEGATAPACAAAWDAVEELQAAAADQRRKG